MARLENFRHENQERVATCWQRGLSLEVCHAALWRLARNLRNSSCSCRTATEHRGPTSSPSERNFFNWSRSSLDACNSSFPKPPCRWVLRECRGGGRGGTSM